MISKMSESFSDTDNRDVTEIDEEINLGKIPCYQKWLLKGFMSFFFRFRYGVRGYRPNFSGAEDLDQQVREYGA